MSTDFETGHGALVGWTTREYGERIILCLQSVTSPPPHEEEDVHANWVLMDRNQAVQLGNNLFEITGQSVPRKRKRGWMDRLLGA